MLRVTGDQVAETTTFDNTLFRAFGLPEVWPGSDRPAGPSAPEKGR